MALLYPIPTPFFCNYGTKFNSKISTLFHELDTGDCGENTKNQHFLLPFKTYIYPFVICELEVGGTMTWVAKEGGQSHRWKMSQPEPLFAL